MCVCACALYDYDLYDHLKLKAAKTLSSVIYSSVTRATKQRRKKDVFLSTNVYERKNGFEWNGMEYPLALVVMKRVSCVKNRFQLLYSVYTLHIQYMY